MEDLTNKNIRHSRKSEQDVFADPQYICKSSTLITSSLKRGAEVVQMPNGDVIVSETRRVTNQFHWNQEKKQFKKIGVEIE
jgi:hypothetical protein